MNKTMRYEIIKPIDIEWKEFGGILRSLQKETREIANKTIQLCWEYNDFKSDYKNKFDTFPNNKDILGYVREDGYCYDRLKHQYSKFNSRNYTVIVTNAANKWKNDLSDIRKGEKSIVSFRNNQPLDIHNNNISIIKEGNQYMFNLSLISNPYKKELDRKSGQFLVLVKVGDNNHKCILDRCLSGEYKISASKLLYDKRKNKWFVNLCYGFEPKKTVEINNNNIMGIDMGIVYPAYMAFNNSHHRYSIHGGEIEHFRKTIESRKKQLQRQGKYCGNGRIGHGIKTRVKPLEFAKNRIANFTDTWNHKYSKYIVDMAVKHGCGVIQMEDLSGISKDDKFLKNWSYYDLQSKIEYKAKEKGIVVNKINPKYTSQRCSECGNIHSDNRKRQSDFECVKCGYKTNADYNAARNIATPNIDRVIAETPVSM